MSLPESVFSHASKTPFRAPLLQIRHVVASGVLGGIGNNDPYSVRPLTEVTVNNIVGATVDLGASTWTLPAGLFFLQAYSQTYNNRYCYLHLIDSGDTVHARSVAVRSHSSTPTARFMFVNKKLSSGISITYKLIHYMITSSTTTNLGVPSFEGPQEIYTNILIYDLNNPIEVT